MNVIGSCAKKLENLLFSKIIVIGQSSSKCPSSHNVSIFFLSTLFAPRTNQLSSVALSQACQFQLLFLTDLPSNLRKIAWLLDVIKKYRKLKINKFIFSEQNIVL